MLLEQITLPMHFIDIYAHKVLKKSCWLFEYDRDRTTIYNLLVIINRWETSSNRKK